MRRGGAHHSCLYNPQDFHLCTKRVGGPGHRTAAGDGQAHVVLCPAAHRSSTAGLPGRLLTLSFQYVERLLGKER